MSMGERNTVDMRCAAKYTNRVIKSPQNEGSKFLFLLFHSRYIIVHPLKVVKMGVNKWSRFIS